MNHEYIEALEALSTSCISDAMDRLGIAGQCQGIQPLDRSFRLAGHAYTLKYVAIGREGGTVGDFVDELGPGQVAVLDNEGRLDSTVWGDLLTTTARRRGVAGTVIDGVCRDVDRALALGYPIFSRGNYMRTGKDRVRLAAVNEPVIIGGVNVLPGDLLRGDGDGLVVVPGDRAAEVLEAAEEIQQIEELIRARVETGTDLVVARERVGYHQLQTPTS